MIKLEYEKLLSMIESSTDYGKVSLEEILKEAVTFFEVLRKEFPGASKEQREEMIQMMTHLHTRLHEVSVETAKSAGMTEEELSVFAENPANFSPEQWQMVQETRRALYDSARKFSDVLEQGKQGPVSSPKPIKPKVRKSHRKDWLQS